MDFYYKLQTKIEIIRKTIQTKHLNHPTGSSRVPLFLYTDHKTFIYAPNDVQTDIVLVAIPGTISAIGIPTSIGWKQGRARLPTIELSPRTRYNKPSQLIIFTPYD